jgi:pyruvate dehydrogenase E2 component (dihydrolipoamide acetyltransferase)
MVDSSVSRTEFRMPRLGADMTAGTLVAWRKRAGDAIHRGDIIAEVDTEKGAIEVECFLTGVIEKLLVEPGATVPVGMALALVREEGTPDSTRPAAPAAAPPPSTPPAAVPAFAPARPPPAGEPGRLRISPAARVLARELGVDPALVDGTGPGGAITREDVERAGAAARPPPPPTPAAASERSRRMRQAIAAAMSRSKREIPHLYLATTVDLHRPLEWLSEANLERPVAGRLLPAALYLKAVALALREVPELNSTWAGGRAVPGQAVHAGMGIALREGGLVAPALHHTDRQTLGELMRNLRDLVDRARAGSLRSSELADPTITVTSLGEEGVEAVFGIIYPPQVAVVGFGKIVERPWVVEGKVVPRPVVTATLSADHRVCDGHRGALFLAAVERLLQEPEKL